LATGQDVNRRVCGDRNQTRGTLAVIQSAMSLSVLPWVLHFGRLIAEGTSDEIRANVQKAYLGNLE
jgi:ABC-type branched-subunit amino acid transport system ATPase component